ncbi:hypothetical protein [Vibrio sp. 10N.222.49.C9]|uniref:hypothetical protein n=1 Tax=Vibrio sp. 10N.222.49.C9 TaxID=3229615 RepID=UPI0035506921
MKNYMLVINVDGQVLVESRLNLCLSKDEEERLQRSLWPEYDLMVSDEDDIETDEFYHVIEAQSDTFVPIDGQMIEAYPGMVAFEAYTPL